MKVLIFFLFEVFELFERLLGVLEFAQNGVIQEWVIVIFLDTLAIRDHKAFIMTGLGRWLENRGLLFVEELDRGILLFSERLLSFFQEFHLIHTTCIVVFARLRGWSLAGENGFVFGVQVDGLFFQFRFLLQLLVDDADGILLFGFSSWRNGLLRFGLFRVFSGKRTLLILELLLLIFGRFRVLEWLLLELWKMNLVALKTVF